MEEFRRLRQTAGWFGLFLIAAEITSTRFVEKATPSNGVLAVGFLLVVVSVFGPAAAAVLIRAFRGGGDSDA